MHRTCLSTHATSAAWQQAGIRWMQDPTVYVRHWTVFPCATSNAPCKRPQLLTYLLMVVNILHINRPLYEASVKSTPFCITLQSERPNLDTFSVHRLFSRQLEVFRYPWTFIGLLCRYSMPCIAHIHTGSGVRMTKKNRCTKIGQLSYFYDNFDKRGPIFIMFSLLNSERIFGKKELKQPPPLKSVAALPCET